MEEPLILTIVFVLLFAAQTAVFTILLLRLRRRLRAASQLVQRPQPLPEAQPPESILKALRLLRDRSLSAREVSVALRLSREHTARLLKRMVEAGLVTREGKPYRYRLTPAGETFLKERAKD